MGVSQAKFCSMVNNWPPFMVSSFGLGNRFGVWPDAPALSFSSTIKSSNNQKGKKILTAVPLTENGEFPSLPMVSSHHICHLICMFSSDLPCLWFTGVTKTDSPKAKFQVHCRLHVSCPLCHSQTKHNGQNVFMKI